MHHLDLTLATAEQNLAADEALLDACEAGELGEVIRFWEPAQYFVVVGYGNVAGREVSLDFCQQQNIPVLRRCSGGGTVLQGPGCLNYSLVLRVEGGFPLHSISAANEFIMERHREALGQLLRAPVERKGCTDLAIGGLKFCGNAQRRRRRYLLFHGCFLLRADFDLMEKVLPLPSRQPDYRGNRGHADFLMNIAAPGNLLKAALQRAWAARESLSEVPLARIDQLVLARYGLREWNLRS